MEVLPPAPGPQMVDRFNEGYAFEDFAKAVIMFTIRGLYAIKQTSSSSTHMEFQIFSKLPVVFFSPGVSPWLPRIMSSSKVLFWSTVASLSRSGSILRMFDHQWFPSRDLLISPWLEVTFPNNRFLSVTCSISQKVTFASMSLAGLGGWDAWILYEDWRAGIWGRFGFQESWRPQFMWYIYIDAYTICTY